MHSFLSTFVWARVSGKEKKRRIQERLSVYYQPVKLQNPITVVPAFPVPTTLTDVQKHLRTPISPSTILLVHSLESELRALHLAQLLHLPRGRPLKPELTWLTYKDRGPGGHNPKEDAPDPCAHRGSNGICTRTALLYHGNLGAWHVSSATPPATTVACTNDADVLDGLLGALNSHEFVLEQRLLGFGGCPWGSRQRQARIASLSICRKPKPDRRGRYEDGKHADPAIDAASRRRRQHHIRSRDEPKGIPDSTTRSTPTARGAALLLGAWRPTLDNHARRTPGGVPTWPEPATREPEELWDGVGTGTWDGAVL
ncbi:hypothetical protein EDB85DRAFT_1895320 [Lactarius pseudohatsudake]|nr:hypothetical protein EDB85DRAFT_1895320 [Lactarius pseudohatsudake]